MKKIYVKPRTIVIATAASELCQFSAWNTDNARSTEELETTTDWGKVILLTTIATAFMGYVLP